jgi:hypothetical protein
MSNIAFPYEREESHVDRGKKKARGEALKE